MVPGPVCPLPGEGSLRLRSHSSQPCLQKVLSPDCFNLILFMIVVNVGLGRGRKSEEGSWPMVRSQYSQFNSLLPLWVLGLSSHCWLQGHHSGQAWTASQADPHPPTPGLIFSSFPQRHPGKADLPVFPSCSFSHSHSLALQMLAEQPKSTA